MGRYALIFIATIIALSSLATLFTTAQLSEEEALAKFQALGCTSCHNGQVAGDWEEIVEDFKAWSGAYASLDEAVKAEVEYFGGQRFNSYDEMMNVMAQNVGRSIDDPDFKALYDYFKSLYGGQPQQTATETKTETTQTETTPEETTTTPTQPTETTTPPQTTPTETAKPSPTTKPTTSPTMTETPKTETTTERQGIGFGVAAGIAIVIIVIVVGAIFLVTRR